MIDATDAIDAIEQALNVLGSREFQCQYNTCRGCHDDREEAIDILTRTLEGSEKARKEKANEL